MQPEPRRVSPGLFRSGCGAMIGWLFTMACVAAPMGWLGDGTASYPDATPPIRWEPSQVRFKTPLPTWGNASPVVFHDMVCVTSEPTAVHCVDAMTGEIRWSATNDWIETLTGEERVTERARQAELDAAEVELVTLRTQFSALRRESRRGVDVDQQMGAVSDRIDHITSQLATFSDKRTPPDQNLLGYATPTPVTDGEALFVLFSNGVVSRFERDGARAWSSWMGPRPKKMRGFDEGASASLLLAGGVLVSSHGQMRGLSPKTGDVAWEAWAYTDYGTPAVARVGTREVLLTPAGVALYADDGSAAGSDLGDIWFVGPAVRGDQVLFIEGRSDQANASDKAPYRAHTLGAAGGFTHQPLWTGALAARTAFYSGPVFHDDRWYTVTSGGQLFVIDGMTGAQRQERQLDLHGKVYGTPTVAGDHLYITTDAGEVLVLDLSSQLKTVFSTELEATRATPIFVDSRIYVRGFQHLWCVDGELP